MQLTKKEKKKKRRHKETVALTQRVRYICSHNASVGKINITDQHDSKLFGFEAEGLRVADDDRLMGLA